MGKKLWAVTKREYLERVRTKWFLIAALFGPLFFLAIMIVPAWLSIRAVRSARVENVVILDATGAGLGDRVKAKLDALGRGRADSAVPRPAGPTTAARVEIVEPARLAAAESTAFRAVVAKRASGYLVLDSATAAGHAARFAGRNASSLGEMERIERAVEQAVLGSRLVAAGLDPARIDSLTRVSVDLRSERITDRGRAKGGAGTALTAVFLSFLLYMMMILYGQNVLRGVMEEKQTRVAEVVISSVKPETLLAGKVLGVGAVGLTQIALWMAISTALGSLVAPLLARAREAAGGTQGLQASGQSGMAMMSQLVPDNALGMLALLVGFFLLGYVFYSALFAAVGAMVNDEREAQQALQPVMILLVSSALFIQPVAFNPSSTLARVTSILPFSSPIIMPMRMSITSVPPLEIAASLVGLIVGCVAAVWVAARIYRVGLLMYGKRPSMRELMRWIRYA
jgi:ABC-2 type transport system permease protein